MNCLLITYQDYVMLTYFKYLMHKVYNFFNHNAYYSFILIQTPVTYIIQTLLFIFDLNIYRKKKSYQTYDWCDLLE